MKQIGEQMGDWTDKWMNKLLRIFSVKLVREPEFAIELDKHVYKYVLIIIVFALKVKSMLPLRRMYGQIYSAQSAKYWVPYKWLLKVGAVSNQGLEWT